MRVFAFVEPFKVLRLPKTRFQGELGRRRERYGLAVRCPIWSQVLLGLEDGDDGFEAA